MKHELDGLGVIVVSGRTHVLDQKIETGVEQGKESGPKKQTEPDDQRRSQPPGRHQLPQPPHGNVIAQLPEKLGFVVFGWQRRRRTFGKRREM